LLASCGSIFFSKRHTLTRKRSTLSQIFNLSLFGRTHNLSDFIKSNYTNKEPKITDLFILYQSPLDFGIFLIFFATRVAPHIAGNPYTKANFGRVSSSFGISALRRVFSWIIIQKQLMDKGQLTFSKTSFSKRYSKIKRKNKICIKIGI